MAETGKGGADKGASMRVDTALVRELAELLSENELTEIEVEDGDRKIRVKREVTAVAAAPAALAAAPMAPALTALELMKLRGGSTLQREREVLERQISHMTRLVDDLLNVSRLTRGKVELMRRRFEVQGAVERAIDMARPLIRLT